MHPDTITGGATPPAARPPPRARRNGAPMVHFLRVDTALEPHRRLCSQTDPSATFSRWRAVRKSRLRAARVGLRADLARLAPHDACDTDRVILGVANETVTPHERIVSLGGESRAPSSPRPRSRAPRPAWRRELRAHYLRGGRDRRDGWADRARASRSSMRPRSSRSAASRRG